MSEVIFRRIGGRVVPIKVDPETIRQREMHETKKTGGRLLAGGLVGTGAAAYASGSFGLSGKKDMAKASAYISKAKRVASKNMDISNKALGKAGKLFRLGKKKIFAAKALGAGASLIGSGILAEGLARRVFPAKEQQSAQAWTSALVGIPIYFGINRIIKKKAFPFLK